MKVTYIHLKFLSSNLSFFFFNFKICFFRTYPIGYSSAFVDANSKPDTVVAVLTIKDNDHGLAGISNLSIVSGNEGNWFKLESGSNFGIIRVSQLESIEIRRFYELVVQAQDGGTPQRSSQQVVKVIF